MNQEEIRTQSMPDAHLQAQAQSMQNQPMYYPVPAPAGGGGVTLVMILLLMLGFGLVVYELYFVSEENSVINRIMAKAGTGTATFDDSVEKEKTELEYALSTALAEVERISGAYNIVYQTNADVTKMAWQMESALLQSQLEALDSTQAMDKVGVNVASLGCMFLGDPSLCGVKDAMQDNIVKRKKELMENHRSNIPQDIIKQLVSPRDLLSPEFKIMAQKYPSKLGQSNVQPRT